MRESWYFLGWTVTRDQVRGHDIAGAAVLVLSPVIAFASTQFIDPGAAVVGLPFAIIGATHFIISRWVKKTPELAESRPPKLTRRAAKFLTKLSKKVAKFETFGAHYYGRKLSPRPQTQIGTARDFLDPVAFQAFERVAEAYNRVQATIEHVGIPAAPMQKAVDKRMAAALDTIATLEEYPERMHEPELKLNRTIGHFNELADYLEWNYNRGSTYDALNAWIDTLASEAGLDQVEQRH